MAFLARNLHADQGEGGRGEGAAWPVASIFNSYGSRMLTVGSSGDWSLIKFISRILLVLKAVFVLVKGEMWLLSFILYDFDWSCLCLIRIVVDII